MSAFKNSKYLITIFLLAVLYFLFGEISLFLLNGNQIVNEGLFISQGIALAFVLYFGPRVWIGIFVGQFFLAYVNDLSIPASLGIAAINAFVAYLAYRLMGHFKLDIKLQTFRDIFGLVFIIFMVESIGSLSGNLILIMSHTILATNYFSSSFSWWFGNIMGELVITPILLLFLIHHKSVHLQSSYNFFYE